MRGPNCIGVERVFNSPVVFFSSILFSVPYGPCSMNDCIDTKIWGLLDS